YNHCSFDINDDKNTIGISVTPTLLNKYISLSLLCELYNLHGDLNKFYKHWIYWTEYTLYYIYAKCKHILYKYHTINRIVNNHNVNFYSSLSIWKAAEWYKENKQLEIIKSINNGLNDLFNCINNKTIKNNNDKDLFIVLQTNSGISEQIFHKYLFPLFLNYLNLSMTKVNNDHNNVYQLFKNLEQKAFSSHVPWSLHRIYSYIRRCYAFFE
ncbi:unnamed protein product, partial [Didymodactylos carnosus]